jgi:hypothetical protein
VVCQTAERLTKFVASVSAALVCEQASLNSASALLEFPVDPASTFATAVESELLLHGVEASGSEGVNFGVPAAYFYALGANLDKSTTAQRRFLQATGDDIDRLLQQFATTENAGIIGTPSNPDSESFVTPGFSLVSLTSFQAARRLVALHEMLKVSQASTCEDQYAPPASEGQTMLGDAMAPRRGPVGDLLADCANLETPLPLIDIANECLEYLGATQPSTSGVAPSGKIYNTSGDELAGYALCQDDDCCQEKDSDCHEPAAMYSALPEYSTPATPVVGENDSVEPLVYTNLKQDFSSCCLPYSQALDVSRTYLQHLGSCRFEELRTFRKCITEFALSPANPPSEFQSFLWRYPVRIDTAIEYLGITPEEYSSLFQGTRSRACGPQDNPVIRRPTQGHPACRWHSCTAIQRMKNPGCNR